MHSRKPWCLAGLLPPIPFVQRQPDTPPRSTHRLAASVAPLGRFLCSVAGPSGGRAVWLGACVVAGVDPKLLPPGAASEVRTAAACGGARQARLVRAGWLHIKEMAVATLTCRSGEGSRQVHRCSAV